MDQLHDCNLCPSETQAAAHPFLMLLPRLTHHARFYFRFLQCPHHKADAIAEVVALAWRWHLRLVDRGQNPAAAAAGLIVFAARAVACGRRLCGQAKVKDALSRRQPFLLRRRDQDSGAGQGAEVSLAEALAENTRSTIPDQVAFRLDFPTWCRTRTQRERRMIAALMAGERPLDVARKHGLTTARISQLRREFHADWQHYCGMALHPGA
jgi:hypothetical protein